MNDGRCICPICNTKNEFGKTKTIKTIGRQRLFNHCSSCNHWWIEPVPDEAELCKYYSSLSCGFGRSYNKAYHKKKLFFFQKILKNFLPAIQGVLEIGPGPVGILPLLNKNTRYAAVEPSKSNRDSLFTKAAALGVEISVYDSIDEISEDNSFDLVFSNAVFEHLRDPRGVFSRVVALIEPGGLIITGIPYRCVEIPYKAFIPAGLFKEISFCENHLHSFSKESVLFLFEQFDVRLIDVQFTIKNPLVRGYEMLSCVLDDFVENNRVCSGWWALRYLLAIIYLRFTQLFIDRKGVGDDRGEAVYIGIYRGEFGASRF